MSAPVPINTMAETVAPAPVLRILSGHTRAELEGFIAVAIDLLDLADGDPDSENATDAEDEGITPAALAFTDGPGCMVSDPDYAVDDHPCDNDDDREPEDGY